MISLTFNVNSSLTATRMQADNFISEVGARVKYQNIVFKN